LNDILRFFCEKVTKALGLVHVFFSFVSFSTKFSLKNRLFFTIYKFAFLVYNTKAVGGTNSTATHNCLYHLAEYQSYDIKRARDRPTVVLLFFL